MVSYVNVHAVLENRRSQAREAASNSTVQPATSQRADGAHTPGQGPRVIVVGPTDSGKSILTRMLLGWAARKSWKPTYVKLDIGQRSITIPGTIAATPIEMPIDPIEGVPLKVPLVFFYWHTTPRGWKVSIRLSRWASILTWCFIMIEVNTDLYRVLVKELARTPELQFVANPDARAACMVINTVGWAEGIGYEVISSNSSDVLLGA
ncbi:hypothetical protein R1sor_007235 [Riccia sorocarpa]|uniref:Clp1 P-loop domain-containing protein n=1 Tax=Riccia sorocarpa TaxID=122646 RepID=A0ABD3HTB5_9MARC